MKISNNTCKGVTPVNEDYFIGRQLTYTDAITVLCDGMGGLSFGDVAAKTVAEIIASYTCERYTPNTDLKSLLEQAVLAADSALANVAMDYHSKMGTAIAAVLVADNNAYIAWLGNVRVYMVGKDDSIRLLTHDHVIPIGYGKIRLARCIKGNRAIESVPVSVYDLAEAKQICLCTDGYYKMFEVDAVKFDLDMCSYTQNDDASLAIIDL